MLQNIYDYEDSIAKVRWEANLDGMYYRDEDGFGMTDDDEINLEGAIDRKGNVVKKFSLEQKPSKNRSCARHGLGDTIMKKIWCVYITIALLAASVSGCNIKSQDSFSSLLDKARQGDGATYLKLEDHYRTGNGVKRDFFNMITMAQMADLYGYRIDDYINGLPDSDDYKTLFTTMDRHHSCPV